MWMDGRTEHTHAHHGRLELGDGGEILFVGAADRQCHGGYREAGRR